ncbi:V-type ATP synthase subunit D [Aerococcus mictus]|uniref:V-type ATP synthase subunit D n=1 Tax=Aerococcus mictus TaxID=2976810 RepID=UPI002278C3FB|nr:V-type ATP synthase subunit D [Aerococcus mictus]MCY3081135.1 V-type ATP synthase subunit D [Aerococcus mictus]MCY3084755.1 V-type ATP synthase subunit D [Aerococcus mictus]
MANALNVKPTRMELQKLQGNLSIAIRGHKLLKDKQDELMRQFIDLIRKNNDLRQEVEADLSLALENFVLASALVNEAYIDELVAIPSQSVELEIRHENIMSVDVPKMNFHYSDEYQEGKDRNTYSFLNTASELDDAIATLNQVMPKLLELSEIEKTCQLMADDIESTRRRVNALEYRVIPDTKETIAYIQSKLEENERSTKTRMIKIKDMNG